MKKPIDEIDINKLLDDIDLEMSQQEQYEYLVDKAFIRKNRKDVYGAGRNKR